MNELINVNIKNENGKLLVSSRDIAKGLEKEHKHVLSKIREVLNGSEFCPVEYIDEKGEIRPEYMLDKNAFILLVMNYTGYNDFKRAYIKRFNEMEKIIKNNMPQSYSEALRRLAAEVEQRELIEKQRDEALRTKAWISDKKTATAMNTASQKSKEVKKLEIELDKSKEYASTKLIQIKTGKKYDWKDLKKYCITVGLEIKKAQDANYGEVNSYPAEAWKEVYKIEIKEII